MSRVLFLNGASSSGKTTIAKLLHEALRYPEWMYISVDTFLHMMPDHAYRRKDFITTWFPGFLASFHCTIATFAKAGIPVIVDDVLERDGWLEDYQRATEGIQTVYIEVFCPPPSIANIPTLQRIGLGSSCFPPGGSAATRSGVRHRAFICTSPWSKRL